MGIEYENTPLDWGVEGIEPSAGQKEDGYEAGDRLPASHINYLIKNKELVETELQEKLSGLADTVDTKVDKVSGKGLSTNDYTTAEKTKLAGIATGATKVTVEDVLTSTSAVNALSAKQGKALNDAKVDKESGKGLSTNDYTTAEKTKLAGIATGATKITVEDVLTSTSATNALSANQGKALNDAKLPKAGGTITGNLTVNGTFTNTALTETLGTKVDKVEGKGLSTNDYTTAEKTKLAGIATGATKVTVEDVLTSTSAVNALSAKQGKALNDAKLPKAGGTITGNLTVNGTFTNTALTETLGTKVDKVEGKGLSTNDYTTAEKTKLAGIATGATKVTVEDVLTSTSAVNALSAKQGKALNDNKVDKIAGKGLSTNDYTTEEKQKLASISPGATTITVEDNLASTSTTNALSANQGRILNATKWAAATTTQGNVNLNNFTTPGTYYVDVFTGTPGNDYPLPSVQGASVLEVFPAASNRLHQRLSYTDNNFHEHIFERVLIDNSQWLRWEQISTGYIDLSVFVNSEYGMTTVLLWMLNIVNGKFTITYDFRQLNSITTERFHYFVPYTLTKEDLGDNRIWLSYHHVTRGTYNSEIDNMIDDEYRVEWFVHHGMPRKYTGYKEWNVTNAVNFSGSASSPRSWCEIELTLL